MGSFQNMPTPQARNLPLTTTCKGDLLRNFIATELRSTTQIHLQEGSGTYGLDGGIQSHPGLVLKTWPLECTWQNSKRICCKGLRKSILIVKFFFTISQRLRVGDKKKQKKRGSAGDVSTILIFDNKR